MSEHVPTGQQEENITIRCFTSENEDIPCFEFYAPNLPELKESVFEFVNSYDETIDWKLFMKHYKQRFPSHLYITEYESKKSKNTINIYINYQTNRFYFDGYKLRTFSKMLKLKRISLEDYQDYRMDGIVFPFEETKEKCQWYGNEELTRYSPHKTSHLVNILIYENSFSSDEQIRLGVLTFFIFKYRMTSVSEIFINRYVIEHFSNDQPLLAKLQDKMNAEIQRIRNRK